MEEGAGDDCCCRGNILPVHHLTTLQGFTEQLHHHIKDDLQELTGTMKLWLLLMQVLLTQQHSDGRESAWELWRSKVCPPDGAAQIHM